QLICRKPPAWSAPTPAADPNSQTVLPHEPPPENSPCRRDRCESQTSRCGLPGPVPVQKHSPSAGASTRFPAQGPALLFRERLGLRRPPRATASLETRAGASLLLPTASPTFRGPNSRKPSRPVGVHRLHSMSSRGPQLILSPPSAINRARCVCTDAMAESCCPRKPCPRQRSHPSPSQILPSAFR